MNYFDIAILVLLGAFLVKGVVRGLLKELCSLVGLLLGAFLAFRYNGPLGEWLFEGLKVPVKVGAAVTFLILFLATVLFFVLLGHLLSRFVRLIFLGGLNRVAGGLFGLVQGVVLLAIVLFGLTLRPVPAAVGPVLADSELAPPFVRLGEDVIDGSRILLPLAD